MSEEKEVTGTAQGNESEFSAPTESIENCLNIILVIYNAKADSIVSADEIYAIIGKPKGTMAPKVSACAQYGLLVNHNKKGYQVTDFGVSIIRPEFEEIVRVKKLEAFSTPPLYKKLIDRYNSKAMPTAKGLLNILVSEFGLNPNSTGPRAASTFIDNCNSLNITENGRMRFFMPNVTEPLREEVKVPIPAIITLENKYIPQEPEYIEFPIDLGTRVAKFIYPVKVTEDELQIIKIMLEAKLKTLITIGKLSKVDDKKINLETKMQDSDSIT